MDRASRALAEMRYFEAERQCARALDRAYRSRDYERMARIVLPLQEARRQIRQLATDSGWTGLVGSLEPDPLAAGAGCYLVQPPLIGADARILRELTRAAKVPALVLTREPLTRDGKWPVVAVGGVLTLRVRLDPPWPLTRDDASPTKDRPPGAPPVSWFEAAAEALGDEAIRRLRPDEPAAWQVDDLMEFLDAHPDHEKLHQRLDEACRRAACEPAPRGRRHRPRVDDPYSF